MGNPILPKYCFNYTSLSKNLLERNELDEMISINIEQT